MKGKQGQMEHTRVICVTDILQFYLNHNSKGKTFEIISSTLQQPSIYQRNPDGAHKIGNIYSICRCMNVATYK